MERKIFEQYKEQERILKGRVQLVQYSDKYKTDIVQIDLNGVVAIIKREVIDIKDTKASLVPMIGKTIKFVITDIEDDGTLICSRRVVKEMERDILISKLENGEEFDAKIVKILKFGAYLDIKGTTVILKNLDFSNDHTTVSDIHKEGDIVKVKLSKIAPTSRKVFVQAVDKYCSETNINIESFEKDQVVFGRVRTVKTWGCFVCIAPNLDALATTPQSDERNEAEIEEGQSVALRIKEVIPEEGKVRGVIVRIIKDEDEYEID